MITPMKRRPQSPYRVTPPRPWYQRFNYSLLFGIVVALLINGAFLYWLMKQPIPPVLFHLADGMNGLFKPAPQPCPPFETEEIRNAKGKVIEKQFVVPTFLVPENRLPFQKKDPQNEPPSH